MRVVFAGTPPFAAQALEAIVRAGHAVPLVLSQPDRPSGRGLKLTPSAVTQAAERLGLSIARPESLKAGQGLDIVRSAHPDVMVVAAYGLLLPQAVLDLPAHGCLNIHASLLPRWRGAAPVQRAILAGDSTTGISIMRMEAGLDTGPVVLVRPFPIGPRATAGELTQALAELGAAAVVQALATLDSLVPSAQDASQATYARKISKAEARIDWSRPSVEIDRQVRAFNPAPGAEAQIGDMSLKIWRAEPTAGSGTPGRCLSTGGEVVIACGEGALRLLEVQKPGARRMEGPLFARGNPQIFAPAAGSAT